MVDPAQYPRYAEPHLREALADSPVVLIHGPRQCGKTTLAKQVGIPLGYEYLTFDDALVRAAALADPTGFVDGLSERMILDEVQRVPELFLAIKVAVDRRRVPGRLLLAGSANVGAYDDRLRAAYLAYFEEPHDGDRTPPKGDRVMSFPKLLARAMEHPMEWSGRKLEISPDEMKALDRLTFVRHQVEHPRPAFHFIEPLFIAMTLPIAARLTFELLDVCWHHYDDGERATVEATVGSIRALCGQIE